MLFICPFHWGYITITFYQILVYGYIGWPRRSGLYTNGHGEVEVAKSISHHHCSWAWQRGAMVALWRDRDDGDGLGDCVIQKCRGN
jgi:hypothetical protein